LRGYDRDYIDEVKFTKKSNVWDELMLIGELLKPVSVTYLTVNNLKQSGGYIKMPK
jgi:hypothetical protein